MTEATPGPWVWRGKDGSLRQKGEPPYAYGKTVMRPTYDYDSGIDTEVSEADARLIAKAPELLGVAAALRQFIVFDEDSGLSRAEFDAMLSRADAVMAEATGAQ